MELSWNNAGTRLYETGVDRCVLYPTLDEAVVWNGVTGITEQETGGEIQTQYADGRKYVNLMSDTNFEMSLSAFTYPEEFEEFNGAVAVKRGVLAHQQPRGTFNLSYRTLIGNDLKGTDFGYKIHIVYNAKASSEEYAYTTASDDPSAEPFTWNVTTQPVDIKGALPTAHLTVQSTEVSKFALGAIESYLYGYITAPRLLSASEFINFDWSMRPIGILFSNDRRLTSSVLPGDLVYNTENNTVYSVGAESTHTRKVITMSTVDVSKIPIDSYPGDVLYEESTGNLYVLGE